MVFTAKLYNWVLAPVIWFKNEELKFLVLFCTHSLKIYDIIKIREVFFL